MPVLNFKNIPVTFPGTHSGKGEIEMQFAFQNFQHFHNLPSIPKAHPSAEKANWEFIARALLKVGNEIGAHYHSNTDEFYYILEGSADIIIDGEIFKVEAGDLVFTKCGSKHAINNVRKDLLFLAFEIIRDNK